MCWKWKYAFWITLGDMRRGKAELHISKLISLFHHHPQFWFQAVVCFSTPRMYPWSGYFQVKANLLCPCVIVGRSFHCGNRGNEKSESNRWPKLLKSSDFLSKIYQFQGVPKTFVKACHWWYTNLMGRSKLLFIAIYIPTSRNWTIAIFRNKIVLIFCINSWKIEKS